mgnify:CR=1 FL=1
MRLEKEFNARVDMLAWPFGIYDEGLIKKENVTNVEPRDGGTPEFLNEIGQQP